MNLTQRIHFLHRAWRYRLRHEREGVALLRSAGLKGLSAIDIGANRGIYSYWMHQAVGPAGGVYAFEPQPELGQYLRDVKWAFGLRRMTIENSGLSREPGTLILERDPNQLGGASYQHDEAVQPNGFERIETPVTTLDDYFDLTPPTSRIGFIKCDVEGHEANVFRGGARLLAEHRPLLLFECHRADDTDNEVFSLLREYGYSGHCFTPNGEQPVERYSELASGMTDSAKYNFVFRPERVGASAAA